MNPSGLRGAQFQAVFARSSYVEIGWNLWGFLPHFLPQQNGSAKIILEMIKDPWKDPDSRPGDFDAELDQAQVEINEGNPDAGLSLTRATEVRALLLHARPHGGNAAERVKRARPKDRSA